MLKASLKVATCGIFTALSVVLMFLGGTLYIFAYVVPMLLGLIMILMKKTLGTSSVVSVYLATSIITFLFVPDKEAVLLYVLFFGYYPIIKSSLDKIKPKALGYFVKLLIFNVSIFVIELLCVKVFGIPFFEDGTFSIAILVGFALVMNLIFIMYEYILKVYLQIYAKKYEKKVLKFFKGKR